MARTCSNLIPRFHVAQGEFAFDNIHLLHDDSVVTGSAAYNPSSRAFRLDLVGNNFDLAHIPQIQSERFSVEGRADFVLKGSGTPGAPSLNASVHVRDLTLDHELAGELDLQGVTHGSELHLTGNSHFQRGSLLISGNVQLRDGYPANLSFHDGPARSRCSLALLLPWPAYGTFCGHRFRRSAGPTSPARAMDPRRHRDRALARCRKRQSSTIRIPFDSLWPISRSTFSNSMLLGDGTDLTAHGSIQLSGPRALDLTADGRARSQTSSPPSIRIHFLRPRHREPHCRWDRWREPLPQGRFQVANGALSYAGLPSGLSELNGSLLFTRDHVHIETLTARTGGGTLDLRGDANYVKPQLNFNLTAAGKDVRLRYPPGVSSTANTELHWIGSRSASTVSGEISITKIAVTPGFDFSAYLERSRQFSTLTVANSPLNNVKLDIHVQTAPELQMRTAIARLSGDADLRLRGSVARPAVLGRVDILEGKATFHGIRFTLERGDITFANPVAIEPQLNLQASSHVRNYDLNITVTGTPDRLNINYRSEPPLA